eukprot:NODE_7219_length_243_cov_6.788660_g7136_i0.p2 GENE.NODE_7219_length_243_cov_6.788660_g7136_i0~~NODE_7219_length_243_cov_6.788660_g7136_i0.p2  ORF type:complete len:52 (+),score=13.03 NODE_7219_length_243_cov_6.788660_g7136_i0:56-211(+)
MLNILPPFCFNKELLTYHHKRMHTQEGGIHKKNTSFGVTICSHHKPKKKKK